MNKEDITNYNCHYLGEIAVKEVMNGRTLWTGQEHTLFNDEEHEDGVYAWKPFSKESHADLLMRRVEKVFPHSGFEVLTHGDSVYVFGRSYRMGAGLWVWECPCKIFATTKEIATAKTIVAVETFKYMKKKAGKQ